jgi:hypothetical protein
MTSRYAFSPTVVKLYCGKAPPYICIYIEREVGDEQHMYDFQVRLLRMLYHRIALRY